MVVAAILQRLEHGSRLLSRFGSNFANGALSRCRDIRLLRIAANFFGGHGYFGDCLLRSKSIKLYRATKELNKAEYSHSVEDKQIDLCVLRPCRKPLGKAPVRFLSRSEGASKAQKQPPSQPRRETPPPQTTTCSPLAAGVTVGVAQNTATQTRRTTQFQGAKALRNRPPDSTTMTAHQTRRR